MEFSPVFTYLIPALLLLPGALGFLLAWRWHDGWSSLACKFAAGYSAAMMLLLVCLRGDGSSIAMALAVVMALIGSFVCALMGLAHLFENCDDVDITNPPSQMHSR